ncbi:MAG: SRPBCC family protein [Patescibacteria group bacterium]|nr:SRPBCC family protein [Patescibacteria group bacterium]
MIILEDSIKIKTTPEKIFDWFKNLDKHFTEWSPCHTKFVKVTGGMDEGDIVYCEQCCEGKWYKEKVKITKIEKDSSGWRIERKCLFPYSLLGIRGSFIVEQKGDSCIFTAIESFGFKTPIIG